MNDDIPRDGRRSGDSRREQIARERQRYRDRDTYRVPRPRNIRDRDKRVSPVSGVVTIVVLAVLAVLGLIAFWTYSYQFGSEQTVALTVNRLDDQATGSSGHKYLVFTTRADGTAEVFQNTDSFFHGKWNSSDVQAGLKPGTKYACDVYGHRHPVLSQYRIILSCTPAAKS